MDAEFEFVRLAGRPVVGDSEARELRKRAGRGIDWDRAHRLSIRHGLFPLVHRTVERLLRDDVPTAIRERSRARMARHALRGLGDVRELLAILNDLLSASIVAVPYKGPALSSQLYGDLGMRQSCDLDVLVAPGDVSRARQVLIRRGYGEREPMSGARGSFMLERRYSQRFEDGSRPVIELHWGFTNGDVGFPMTLEGLAPNLTATTIGGREVPAFAVEDLVLILSVHGSKHRWNRLEWIVGLAEAARRVGEARWPAVLAKARELRCERAVLLGLKLACEYGQLVLPTNVLAEIASDPLVPRLVAEVEQLLLDEHPRAESEYETLSLEHDLFHFRLRKGLRERLRYLRYRFTTPSRPEHWRAVEVGGRSVALHSVVRPFQVVARLVPALWAHLRGNRHGSAEDQSGVRAMPEPPRTQEESSEEASLSTSRTGGTHTTRPTG